MGNCFAFDGGYKSTRKSQNRFYSYCRSQTVYSQRKNWKMFPYRTLHWRNISEKLRKERSSNRNNTKQCNNLENPSSKSIKIGVHRVLQRKFGIIWKVRCLFLIKSSKEECLIDNFDKDFEVEKYNLNNRIKHWLRFTSLSACRPDAAVFSYDSSNIHIVRYISVLHCSIRSIFSDREIFYTCIFLLEQTKESLWRIPDAGNWQFVSLGIFKFRCIKYFYSTHKCNSRYKLFL